MWSINKKIKSCSNNKPFQKNKLFYWILMSLVHCCSSFSLLQRIHQPAARCLIASVAPAPGRIHADQLIKNHLVRSTNKAVAPGFAHGMNVWFEEGQERRGLHQHSVKNTKKRKTSNNILFIISVIMMTFSLLFP